MSDSVKGIFKTLIKIPVIIIICYAVFNAFAFGITYFKMLGLSYVAMQTAMENNFIPARERATIEDWMQNEIETGIVQNVSFTSGTTFNKQQYGEEVTVGVQAYYRVIWPLMPTETINGTYNGVGGNTFGGNKTSAELQATRDALEAQRKSNIVIEYKVPGLKYYSDLDN